MILTLIKNLFVVSFSNNFTLFSNSKKGNFNTLLISKKGNVNMIVTLMILVALMVILFLLINNWDALAGSLVGDGENLVMEGIL